MLLLINIGQSVNSFFLIKDRQYVYTSEIMFPLYANYIIVFHVDTCWILKPEKSIQKIAYFCPILLSRYSTKKGKL